MNDASELREHPVGEHSVSFELPDTYIIRQVGDITGAQMTELYDLVARFGDEVKAPLFGIINMEHGGNTAQDARRTVVSRVAKAHRGLAFVGVPVVARVGISLGYKAYVMLNRSGALPHAFVDTEDDGRKWIAEHRQQPEK
jgi:hypothetical protein